MLTRRCFLGTGAAAVATVPAGPALAKKALRPKPFNHDTVAERARTLASRPHEPPGRRVPQQILDLDWDNWRQIQFKPDRNLLHDPAGRLRLQAFHIGHLFKRPVRLNLVRDDMAEPIAYMAGQFDYGPNRFDPPLPPDLGFAGWRIAYPLNTPGGWDELVSFLGSSYFRVLGKDQVYGLSARGLSIGSGLLDNNEEFPFFREFWFEAPEEGSDPASDGIVFHAVLDSPSLTGAYTFVLHPGEVSTMDIGATLFARRRLEGVVGFAPLTSMFFIGENDRHYNDRNRYDDYRPEMHDSDGLRIQLADGTWLWRPLRNPLVQERSYFPSSGIRGFGLMQRDREFMNYQDIDLAYHKRPSYWIEPKGDWGPGRLELIELATKDETADNIVLAWLPDAPVEPGKPVSFSYRLSSGLEFTGLTTLGRVAHTFNVPVGALGSREQREAGSRRFIVDFARGDLEAALATGKAVTVQAKVDGGKVIRTFHAANPHVAGLRVFLDVKGVPTETVHMAMRVMDGDRPLTETWVYRWKAE